jgi:hypothetical protein
MHMKIYLAGPMRGHKSYNFPTFMYAEQELVGRSYDVANPARMDLLNGTMMAFHKHDECWRLDPDPANLCEVCVWEWDDFVFIPCGTFDFHEALRRDIHELATCDGIVMLPGWQDSEGAKKEHYVATQVLGIKAYDYAPDHPVGITLQKGEKWQERSTTTKAKKNSPKSRTNS